MTTLTGLDTLITDDFAPLRGKRVALMTNPSAVTRDLQSAYQVFRRANGNHFRLTALFSPEHGFAAAVPDGEKVDSSIDPLSGVPIHSLYGANFRPTPAMFTDVDILVCDIQDVGVRYYTFASTITYLIEVAGEVGVPVLLLDRPNPLGDAIDGFRLTEGYQSLVGRFPIPAQHGLTLGELVRLVNARFNPTPAALTVMPCRDYQRGQAWESTGLHFVTPSPNMPHLVTVRHYPGSCLIEGTPLSEGRGTSLPFEICGAPHLNSEALADQLNAHAWEGVIFRPHAFLPTASKHRGVTCFGVQAHITDLARYRPLKVWIGVIKTVRALYPNAFEWVSYSERLTIDLLGGGTQLREQIEANVPLEEMVAEWDAVAAEFRAESREFWLYE